MSFKILKKTGQMTLITLSTLHFFSQHNLLVIYVILKALNYAALKFQSKEKWIMPPYLDLNYGLDILDNEISGQKNHLAI